MPILDYRIKAKDNTETPVKDNKSDPTSMRAVSMYSNDLDCNGEKVLASFHVKNPMRKLFTPIIARSNRRVPSSDKENNSFFFSDGGKIGEKRSYDDDETINSSGSDKRRKLQLKMEALKLFEKVEQVKSVCEDGPIYDSCPEVVEKIQDFLQRDGITTKMFTQHLGIHGHSLRAFLRGNDQQQCGNVTYRRGYTFFEKLRILEGGSKCLRRLQNEQYTPYGFSTQLVKTIKSESVKVYEHYHYC